MGCQSGFALLEAGHVRAAAAKQVPFKVRAAAPLPDRAICMKSHVTAWSILSIYVGILHMAVPCRSGTCYNVGTQVGPTIVHFTCALCWICTLPTCNAGCAANLHSSHHLVGTWTPSGLWRAGTCTQLVHWRQCKSGSLLPHVDSAQCNCINALVLSLLSHAATALSEVMWYGVRLPVLQHCLSMLHEAALQHTLTLHKALTHVLCSCTTGLFPAQPGEHHRWGTGAVLPVDAADVLCLHGGGDSVRSPG